MNGTKKEWLDAILRCMYQDEYGDRIKCELCKQAGYYGDPNCDPVPKCRNCVCHDYFEESEIPFEIDGFPCWKILSVSNIEWEDTGTIRQILQQVYDWLKSREEI